MVIRVLFVITMVGACGNVQSQPPADAPITGDAPAGDAAVDAPGSQARCDPAKPFGAPVLVENVNSSNDEFSFSMTRDEAVGFVGRVIQPPTSSATILVTQRAPATDRFGVPSAALTAALNGAAGNEHSASPVADGLILYFHRQDSNGIGIYAATRNDAQAAFTAGSPITVDGSQLLNALSAAISADGQTLYWLDFADFGKVFSATRGATPTGFTGRRSAATIAIGGPPILSADELTMYYALGSGADILVSTRGARTEMFGTGVPVANVNSAMSDTPAALSRDGCVLYISSNRSGGVGGYDLWQATRPL